MAGTSVYVCTEHMPQIVGRLFEQLDTVLALIRQCEVGRDISSLLEGPISSSVLKDPN